jgi:hypothetical protein
MNDDRKEELLHAIDNEIRHLDTMAKDFLNYDPEALWRDRNMFAAAIRQPIGLLSALREEIEKGPG